MKHIILAADDNYAIPCIVTITSLLSNNTPADFAIHILTQGFNNDNTELFKDLRSKFKDAEIEIVNVDIQTLKDAITSERFPISNFFRLLTPQLFDFDKALYLDADIIVNGDISKLWDIDMKDKACCMVEDQACEDITLHNRIRIFTPYYNAGVLLMNLKYWREKEISKTLSDYMKNYPERCLYPDQDAINANLAKDIIPLDYKFNVQERWYEPQDCWLMHRDKWEKIEEAKKHPIIIHYTGGWKPWTSACTHPLADLFNKYKSIIIKDSSKANTILSNKSESLVEQERRKKHKHIRRANSLTIAIVIETIFFILYIIFS